MDYNAAIIFRPRPNNCACIVSISKIFYHIENVNAFLLFCSFLLAKKIVKNVNNSYGSRKFSASLSCSCLGLPEKIFLLGKRNCLDCAVG